MNIATHKCRPYVNDERIRKQVNKFIFHKKWQMKRDFFLFFFVSLTPMTKDQRATFLCAFHRLSKILMLNDDILSPSKIGWARFCQLVATPNAAWF